MIIVWKLKRSLEGKIMQSKLFFVHKPDKGRPVKNRMITRLTFLLVFGFAVVIVNGKLVI
jgi:hypothetical protein